MEKEKVVVEQKHKTGAQLELIDQLVQSKALTKREFEQITYAVEQKVETAKDASVVITYLLATIEYRKRFLGKNRGSRDKCYTCGSKTGLHKFVQLPDWKQRSLCKKCREEYNATMRAVESATISLIEEVEETGQEQRITIPAGEQ